MRSVAVAPPRELLGALERKGLLPLVCDSHADALAELVIHEREVRAAATQRPMVLLVVEPELTPGVVELIERVYRFAPHALIWRYNASHRPPLAAWAPVAPKATADASRPAIQATVRPRPAPALRLTEPAGEPEVPSPAPHSAEIASDAPDLPHTQQKTSQGPNGPILTQDELSMLLSDDWESHT